MDSIHCARQKAVKLLDELEQDFQLIERRRQGLGKPNLIYVKDLYAGLSQSNYLKYGNHTSESLKNELPVVPKSNGSNTEKMDVMKGTNIMSGGILDSFQTIIPTAAAVLSERRQMLRMTQQEVADTGIVKFMDVLLSSSRAATEKKKILEEEFGVAMNKELEREVLVMCNLSQGVKAEGREEGINIGEMRMLVQLVRDGDLKIERAAEKAKMTVEQFKKVMENTPLQAV